MGNLQSTSSSNNTNFKNDVFISFRGEDTRRVFTSHLYEGLRRKNLEAFIDYKLEKGDDISPALSKAIEESKISVVIFSEDYASSKWCLRELVEVMKHENKIVIPVFYDVDPSDVRNQTGSFKNSFDKHEKELPTEAQTWREALTKASNKSGWDSFVEGTDAALVREIVNDIWEKLIGQYISPGFGGLIGHERINPIISLLCLHDRTKVLIIGILGMGGIGKTTLADAIFNNNSNHFQGVCFIQNVRERLQNSGGLAALQKEILSKVLKDKKLELDSPTIPPEINIRLKRIRVFIVLDDVDDFSQMENLVKGVDVLGKGSRILITSRDRQVLQNCRVNNDNIYEVEGFNPHEALQLFRSYAFKDSHPTDDFTVLSEEFVKYAKGNTLALKVVGSSLYQKSKQEWESAVNTLQTNLDRKIFDVLKISFDGLNNREKNIFLDIACCLKGRDRKHVAKILNDCYYSLSILNDKSLITISSNETIEMHDLLQEMGWKIVYNESPEEVGKRSRLWRQEDVLDMLKHDDGTNAVQGIVLNMSKIKDIDLSPQAFMKMRNLRLLKFYDSSWIKKYSMDCSRHPPYHSKVHFAEGLSDLSKKLRSLIWLGYPLPILPSNFNPDNLVELDLRHSNVERLWEDTMHAPKLKRLVLSYCTCLTKISGLLNSPLIEEIDISYCSSLLVFPQLAQHVNNLRDLFMQGCESLRSFPSDIHFESISSLDLHGCKNLTKFPEISWNITHLDLSWTAIDEVPPSIQCLTKLRKLNLSDCTRLQHITTSIWKLKSLNELNLENCSRLESLPEILDAMGCLITLKLSGTSIKELPENLGDLKSLIYLKLNNCNMLQSLTELPSSLNLLCASDCKQLRSIPDASEFAKIIRYEECFTAFIFTNCLKLEAGVGNMLAQLRQYLNKESGILDFCYSGSEVPGWFIHRTEGCSIKFGVPEWHELMGFAVCAVIAFEENCYVGDSEDELDDFGDEDFGDTMEVSYSFISNNKLRGTGDITVACKNKTSIDSDYVALRLLPCSLSLPYSLIDEFTNCSLKFWLSKKIPNCRVKNCGLCPIYAKQNIGETSGRSRTSNDHQEEVLEPHSKKLNHSRSLSL